MEKYLGRSCPRTRSTPSAVEPRLLSLLGQAALPEYPLVGNMFGDILHTSYLLFGNWAWVLGLLVWYKSCMYS